MEKKQKTYLGIFGVLIIFVAVILLFNSGALHFLGLGSIATTEFVNKNVWEPTITFTGEKGGLSDYSMYKTNLLEQVFSNNKEYKIHWKGTSSTCGSDNCPTASAEYGILVSLSNNGIFYSQWKAEVTWRTSNAITQERYFIITKKGVYIGDNSYEEALANGLIDERKFSQVVLADKPVIFFGTIQVDALYVGHKAAVFGGYAGNGATTDTIDIQELSTLEQPPITGSGEEPENPPTGEIGNPISPPDQFAKTISSVIGRPINFVLISITIILALLGVGMVWYSRRN